MMRSGSVKTAYRLTEVERALLESDPFQRERARTMVARLDRNIREAVKAFGFEDDTMNRAFVATIDRLLLDSLEHDKSVRSRKNDPGCPIRIMSIEQYFDYLDLNAPQDLRRIVSQSIEVARSRVLAKYPTAAPRRRGLLHTLAGLFSGSAPRK